MTKWVCIRKGDSLQHHGIKGMKWGRRRFQNADGSLTAAGKKRYGYDVSDYVSASKKVENVGRIINTAKKAKKDADVKSYEKQLRADLSKMSDRDLMEAVNRLNMEERYTQVMKQRKQLEVGKGKVDTFLEVAGSTVAGTATALAIMASITQLLEHKNKK